MDIFSILLSASISMFSLGLFFVSIVSYRKYQNKKLLGISVVFSLFLLKGILLSLQLFTRIIPSSFPMEVFDLLILIILFIVTLKR